MMTRTMIGRIAVMALLPLLGPAVPAAQTLGKPPGAAAGPSGAKALFYGSSGATLSSSTPGPAVSMRPAAADPEPYMGVSYWIELVEPSGAMRRVTTDHMFRAGDRIRLSVQSNRDGYLSLINLGTTGRAIPLFPGAGQDGAVRANQVYQVPPNSYLRFDHNPGEETLVLVLSPGPLGGPSAAPALPPSPPIPVPAALPGAQPGGLPSQPGMAMPGAGVGAAMPAGQPGGLPPLGGAQVPAAPGGPQQSAAAMQPASTEDAERLLREALAKGAKDLIVETEGSGAQPASYAVARLGSGPGSGMVTLQIKLKHQ